MAGTVTGGKAAAQTNKTKYGPDFYREIGRKGGSVIRPETRPFTKSPELAKLAGKIGGTKSRRGPKTRIADRAPMKRIGEDEYKIIDEAHELVAPKKSFWQRLLGR